MAEDRQKPITPWTAAGIVAVFLAILLLALGLLLGIGQARSLAALRLADVHKESFRLRSVACHHLETVCTTALTEVVNHYRAGKPGDPFAGRRDPAWLRTFFVWSEREFRAWPADRAEGEQATANAALESLVRRHLQAQMLSVGAVGKAPVFRFVSDQLDDRAIVLATLTLPAGTEAAVVAAVNLDLDLLKSEYLDGLFDPTGSLRVVVGQEEDSGSPGWRALAPSLPAIRVEIRPDFVATQNRAVHLRIALFIAVAVVSLAALLVMMWMLIRRVHREVALSRLKSGFVAGVSHELKTPLANIRMFAETLLEGRVQDEEKKREYYRIITQESGRLTHLIENILDFSRIDAGRKEYTVQPINVGAVVADTYEVYRFDLDRRGFEHHLKVADNLPEVRADPDAVAQALVNLIGNAVKYSPEEKSLVIEVEPETRRGKHGVLISVKDRGIGIRPEDRAHLFDGFFRAADERVRRKRGAGLGLSLVKHVVDVHGGSIDVESRLVKGTTFRIFLPESK